MFLLLSVPLDVALCSQPAWAYVPASSQPWGETAVLNRTDFDGDSKPDMAVGTFRWSGYTIEIRLTTRVASTYLTLAEAGLGTKVFACDVDHDSYQDLVVTSATSLLPIAVFLGDGKGHFQAGRPWLFLPLSALDVSYRYGQKDSASVLDGLVPQSRFSVAELAASHHAPGLQGVRWLDRELETTQLQLWMIGCKPRSPPALLQL